MIADFDKANDTLFKCVQNASLEVLKSESKLPSFEISHDNAPDEKALRYYEEISCILLISQDFKLIFKTHYWLNDMTKIINNIRPGLPHASMEKKARDFAKELCNIIAGRIKYQFVPLKCALGQSLPINLDGFNQIFFSTDNSSLFTNSWAVSDGSINLCFSTTVEYYNQDIVKKICQLLSITPTKAPEVELF